MPVLGLGLASSSAPTGVPGDCYLDGAAEKAQKTLGGQRQSALNSSCEPLLGWASLRIEPLSMETTQELSKAGKATTTATEPRTPSSGTSTFSFTLFPDTSASAPDMSRANLTQPMIPLEESWAPWKPSFLTSPPQSNLTTSSLMPVPLPHPPSSLLSNMGNILLLPPKSSTMQDSRQKSSNEGSMSTTKISASAQALSRLPRSSSTQHQRFGIPAHQRANSPPRLSHHADSILPPSPLRPPCLAKDRLRLWRPAQNPVTTPLPAASDEQLERILQVIDASWNDSTKSAYGSGLQLFHVFCEEQNIPEELRCPAPVQLILAFISCCAGAFAGSTLANYSAGLKAWHLLHGQPWSIDPDTLKRCLEGANKLAPPSSKRALRPPFTMEIIAAVKQSLSLSDPLDAAVFACLTVCFWCVARIGEFTVPNLKAFSPTKHVTRATMSSVSDRNGLEVIKFDLLWTKMMPSTGRGESVQCAKQEGPCDPVSALHNHLHINPAPPGSHLFAWKFKDGSFCPLTRKQFLGRVSDLTAQAGFSDLKGHSLHIGGTLEYLLRGVPFKVVQAQGRWAGKAFALYLRKHAMILAPYLQANPGNEPFTRYSQPPVR